MAIDAQLPVFPDASHPIGKLADGTPVYIDPEWYAAIIALAAMLKEIKAEIP